MKTVLEKPVFEMTAAELQEKIRPTAAQDIREAFEKGTYITYFDAALCPNEDTLIHEYQDHRELVEIDNDGKTKFIKRI